MLLGYLIGILILSNIGLAGQESRRIVPLPQLKCDRSDLTSYEGRVLSYRRRLGSTVIRIRTDFDTTEDVTIRHPGTDDPAEFYLLNGERFRKSDWSRIERKGKGARPGIRVSAWVCRGNPSIQPVIDWKPNDTGANPRGGEEPGLTRSIQF